MKCKFVGVTIALAWAVAVQAQTPAELPSAVATFKQVCLAGNLNPAARPAALAAAGWRKAPAVAIDVPKLGISKAIERNYDFSKPEAAEQWTGVVDGRPASAVLATYSAKRPHRQLCALVIDGVTNAMPYHDELKAAFKDFGISGKSVDLVHYFEYAGKVGAEKHRVRGEIFTRSLASGAKNSMHIYVAY